MLPYSHYKKEQLYTVINKVSPPVTTELPLHQCLFPLATDLGFVPGFSEASLGSGRFCALSIVCCVHRGATFGSVSINFHLSHAGCRGRPSLGPGIAGRGAVLSVLLVGLWQALQLGGAGGLSGRGHGRSDTIEPLLLVEHVIGL